MLLTKKRSVDRMLAYKYGGSAGLLIALLHILVIEGHIPLQGWAYLFAILFVILIAILLATNARKRSNTQED